MTEIDIRYTYVTDILYLRQWLRDPQVQKWFPVVEEKEIEDALQCWIGFSRYSSSLTAVIDGTPCGIATLFLMPYRKVAHHALFKIVVGPEFQRRGVGTSLLKNLKHLAKNYFHLDLIHTEIFTGNPLTHLLEAQGFQVYAQQDNYVKDQGHYLGRILYETFL